LHRVGAILSGIKGLNLLRFGGAIASLIL